MTLSDARQRAGSRYYICSYTQLCQILPLDTNYGGYLLEVTFIIVVMMLLLYRDTAVGEINKF